MRPALFSAYESCELCPRRCRVDRTRGQRGFCGQSATLRLALVEAHFGEEPAISGSNGSGTVFFSGCSLQCRYCQNWQLTHQGWGRPWEVGAVVAAVMALRRQAAIHNLNLVTPDHFLPHVVAIVEALRARGEQLPVVANVSGYQRRQSLRWLHPVVDVYLPDFKYGDRRLAAALSSCPDYAAHALEAIGEMVRQKGFLQLELSGREVARRGVLVRHLVLPGQVANSLQALDMLLIEFGPELPLSLMSQYYPVRPFPEGSPLNRTVRREEFSRVLAHARDLGFRFLYVQPLEEDMEAPRPFLPDFQAEVPFPGNRRRQAVRAP